MPEQLLNDLRTTLAAARSQLEYLADLGEVKLDRAPADAVLSLDDDAGARLDETLDAIRDELGDCQRCGLAASRKKLVYGVGNPNARLVLVGEAPGREEDQKGEPFVGEAGRLLDRILLAMGMQREEVYICNVLKCRPPDNRDPQPDEVAACEAFLIRQIVAIKPQVIIGLGRFAVHSLLKSKVPISRIRGEWQTYQGIPLMPTYHPAYLLRNPEGKRDVWEDMKEVMRSLQNEAEKG
jgi:DNA polymerase